jgi:hypothetical protein
MTDDPSDQKQHKREANQIREPFTRLVEQLRVLPDPARARLQGISFVPFGRGGAKRALTLLTTRPEVREVHVEIDQNSGEGRLLIDALERCGLVLNRTDTRNNSDLTFVRPEA